MPSTIEELCEIDIRRLKEYAYGQGQSAKLLKQFGATDEQVENYISFTQAGLHRDQEKKLFDQHCRKAYQDPLNEKYEHPVYTEYKKLLKSHIQNNARCLRKS